LLDLLYGNTSLTPPATWYFALFTARTWQPGVAYTTSDYVIPTTPNGRVYRVTTAGTSGGTEPTWPTTAAGTVTDGGTLVWTEQSNAMESGTFNQVSTSVWTNYARVSRTNNTTNFPNATGSALATKNNGTVIDFGTATVSGTIQVVGWVSFDAASAGNAFNFAMLSTPKVINNGDPVSFAANALGITLD
jgi:hypothetical protein